MIYIYISHSDTFLISRCAARSRSLTGLVWASPSGASFGRSTDPRTRPFASSHRPPHPSCCSPVGSFRLLCSALLRARTPCVRAYMHELHRIVGSTNVARHGLLGEVWAGRCCHGGQRPVRSPRDSRGVAVRAADRRQVSCVRGGGQLVPQVHPAPRLRWRASGHRCAGEAVLQLHSLGRRRAVSTYVITHTHTHTTHTHTTCRPHTQTPHIHIDGQSIVSLVLVPTNFCTIDRCQTRYGSGMKGRKPSTRLATTASAARIRRAEMGSTQNACSRDQCPTDTRQMDHATAPTLCARERM